MTRALMMTMMVTDGGATLGHVVNPLCYGDEPREAAQPLASHPAAVLLKPGLFVP